MPGVIFIIVVPTANFEQELLNGKKYGNGKLITVFSDYCFLTKNRTEMPSAIATNLHHTISGGNNLNINLPDNNAVLRLEVELRDKNARRRPNYRNKGYGTGDGLNRAASPVCGVVHQTPPNPNRFFIPMEKVRFSLRLFFYTFTAIRTRIFPFLFSYQLIQSYIDVA